MATIKEVQLMKERDGLKTQVEELQEKLASLQKKEAAEELLVSVMNDPRAPFSFKPTTASDFLMKRAQVMGLKNLEAAHAAIKMAQVGDFSIGDGDEPGDSARLFSSGSRADQEFEDWLLAKGE